MTELTDQWAKTALGSIADARLGRTPKKHAYLDSGANKIVKYRDLVGETLDWTNQQRGFVPDTLLPDLVDLREGDVLIGASAHSAEHVGRKVAIVGPTPSSFKSTYVSGELLRLRPSGSVLSRWLLYFFSSSQGYRAVQAAKRGIHLLGSQARQIEVPVAPLPEQSRIVEAIEARFTRMDAAVGALSRARANLKRYRASVLNSVFGTSPRPVSVGNEQSSLWSPMVERWQCVPADQCCTTVANGYTPHAVDMSSVAGEIPYIKIQNLTFDGSLEFVRSPTYIPKVIHEGKVARSRVFPGDVLINIVGPPLGKVSLVPDLYPEWNTNQAVVIFRPGPKLSSRFLCYYLQSSRAISWLASTSRATAGQFNVAVSTCRKLPIPVPPVPEQTEIVSGVERRLSVASRARDETERGLERCARLRESILKAAFAGRLVPQDPTDEPATVLLDRIGRETTTPSPPSGRRRRGTASA